MTKSLLLMVLAAALTAGCSQVHGSKDPTLDAAGADVPQDARIGTPGDDSGANPTDGDANPTDSGANPTDGGANPTDGGANPTDGGANPTDGGTASDAGTPLDAPPSCPSTCPFGCDPGTSTCKAGSLYVYETLDALGANAFGGQDVPPTVRATADNLCFATASSSFPARQCSRNRTHAVISINIADTVQMMASQFSIPVDVGVSRADDGVLVENNWNDLIDLTKVPRAAITTATGDQALIWTGTNGNVSANTTCQGWTSTSTVPTSSGITGRTDLTASPNWLSRAASRCDLMAHLLCICWTGGD